MLLKREHLLVRANDAHNPLIDLNKSQEEYFQLDYSKSNSEEFLS